MIVPEVIINTMKVNNVNNAMNYAQHVSTSFIVPSASITLNQEKKFSSSQLMEQEDSAFPPVLLVIYLFI
jgi:hypothetical protein